MKDGLDRWFYKSKIKNWFCRNFWSWFPRYLTEFKAVCDICECKVGWSDYGYMCKKHGEKYCGSIIPKFILRLKRRNK